MRLDRHRAKLSENTMNVGRSLPFGALTDWLRRGLRLALAGLMLTALAACADNFNAKVTRFQSQLPPAQGQSFAVVADDPGLQGGIEFGQYAQLVAGQLTRLGYVQAPTPDSARLIVRFAYDVDHGRVYTQSTGFGGDPFWGPWHGYGGFYGGGRFGGGGFGSGAWGYGWYDPWFGGGIDSYTIYTSEISLKIDDHASGRRLFEGRAQAASSSNHLPYLVPNLVDAMFTGFPGNSGETMRITVAPEKIAH
jgi:hypothetical protein